MMKSLKTPLVLVCLLCLLVGITMPATATDPDPVSNTPPEITQPVNDSGDDDTSPEIAQPAGSGEDNRVPSIKPPLAPTSKVTPPAQIDQPQQSPEAPFALLMFGQEVVAHEGVIYHESADFAGSGRHGTANNCYTEILRIAGFARVDADTGRLLDYRCYMREDVPTGEPAPDFIADCTEQTLYIATYTDGFTTGSVGWFCIKDLSYTPGELDFRHNSAEDFFAETDIFYYDPNVSADEVAGAIEASATEGAKIALFLDASGSVDQYSAAITAYAEQIDHADFVSVFAEYSCTIAADEYADYRNTVGGTTNISNALNTLPDEAFDIVIIVTDTYDSYDALFINERTDIGAIVILDPEPLERVRQDVIDTIADKWHVAPSLRQLSLE